MLERLQTGRLPDILLLDFDLPGLSGRKGIQSARSLLGDRPLAVLMQGAPLELVRRLVSSGADAVIPRHIQGRALLAAISLLSSRQRFAIFSPLDPAKPQIVAEPLSDRELQVLEGICDGLQNKEIAHAFHIQEVTVKMHVRAITRKLGARNRTEAAMVARDLGIV